MCSWSFLYAFVPILIGICVIDYKEDILTILRIHLNEIENAKFDLLIYIPSAIQNFKKRKAIRNTWWSANFKDQTFINRTQLKFIIGKEGCDIPPEYKIDAYSCQPWLFNNISYGEHHAVSEFKISNDNEMKKFVYAVQKIHFRVHHSIVIKKLSLHGKCRSSRVVVKLLESISQKVIVSKIFEKLSLKDLEENFTHQSIDNYILPKGFQGTLIGENLESGNSEILIMNWNKNLTTSAFCPNNVIEFLMNVDPLPVGHYENEMKYFSKPIHIISFMYELHDVELLSNLINKRNESFSDYKTSLTSMMQKLKKEISKYNDIQLVDVVDVYRNIPLKFLEFSKSLASNINFKYLLKVDDDCYFDLQNIFSMLQTLPEYNTKYTWIGRFRSNWIVERFGKWAENNYTSVTYPKFACGSGYILTSDIIHWISKNSYYLKPYQGEDVSMGIWLSALSINYIDDPYWRCSKDCLSDMYVMPELTLDEQKLYWNNKITCNDVCGC